MPPLPATAFVPDRALLSRSPGETRVALLRGDTLLELHLFRDSRPGSGDCLWGRVLSRLPGAALIDIGAADPAFLPSEDMPGNAIPPPGQRVLVQVVQEPRHGKGAKVTGRISVTGPLLAYTPMRSGVSLSSKVVDKATRSRLQDWGRRALAGEEGVVLRTQAATAPEAALEAELHTARQRWDRIQTQGERPLPLAQALQGRQVAEVLCEGRDAVMQARAARPDLAGVIVAAKGGDLFAATGIDEEIESLLAPTVPLPGGAALHIQATAALTALDVDAGPLKPEEANRLAVAEIARQIRLRALAGMIVIDFVAPRRDVFTAKKMLAQDLRQALSADPVPVQVLGVSALGLVELRRDRLRPPLADLLLTPATPAPLPEAAALAALHRAVRMGLAMPGRWPRLRVSAAVAGLLDGPLRPARQEAETTLGGPLGLEVVAGAVPGWVEVGLT